MRKEHSTPHATFGSLSRNYQTKEQSILNQITRWFRNFMENAE